jgi:hypothetical protein
MTNRKQNNYNANQETAKFQLIKHFTCLGNDNCRAQWRRGLRHELSSPAQTLGSWVRIPLEAWIYVCIYSVFVLPYVQEEGLHWADPPFKESYRL